MSKVDMNILGEKFQNFKCVEIDSIDTLDDLESLGEGTFIIDKFPSIKLVKQFPAIFNCSGEVALDYIDGVFLLTISNNNGVCLPLEFGKFFCNNRDLFSLHSHPSIGPFQRYPSFEDVSFYGNNIFYIITDMFLLEIDASAFDSSKSIFDSFKEFWNDGSGYDYSFMDSFLEDFHNSLGIVMKRYTNDIEIEEIVNEAISRAETSCSRECCGKYFSKKNI